MSGGAWIAPKSDDIDRILASLADPAHAGVLTLVPREDLETANESPDRALWVYYAEGKPLAFAYLSHFATETPKLEEFAVFVKGMGIGAMAMGALIESLRGNPGFKRFWLHVATTNEPALRLYRKFGFGQDEFLPAHWTNRLGETIDLLRLWRSLDHPALI
ncbi:GNAT family N-acetyltransferase [Thalassospira sp. TSL5-1]|uniref:GNAT family N-acetyltransferase n=1 Tax=Thalassospira sp. TSL5-1 TaxID=1544451 RepID=UPI00093C726C|nr:GNAT family N-acetyltransferase [Thalassospira sp. TSL5-1]OKH90198.1 hypothetical protein LF95_10045 [Thalassospira sp. TSL5-1]